jgi:hypothetical protein
MAEPAQKMRGIHSNLKKREAEADLADFRLFLRLFGLENVSSQRKGVMRGDNLVN